MSTPQNGRKYSIILIFCWVGALALFLFAFLYDEVFIQFHLSWRHCNVEVSDQRIVVLILLIFSFNALAYDDISFLSSSFYHVFPNYLEFFEKNLFFSNNQALFSVYVWLLNNKTKAFWWVQLQEEIAAVKSCQSYFT